MGIIRWALMIPPREPDAFDLFIANASLTEIRTRIDRHGRERRHIRRLDFHWQRGRDQGNRQGPATPA